ncbi:late competence protein ComER [Bacillus massilinigeriensis]|uniref:late competence protein ComER n=1 Tax=Bacillus mediterraneensis TaxID=1805474 RepID=UPI0008F8B0EC|nr:late competence protein ComER [Bacillus mediterraneensis]
MRVGIIGTGNMGRILAEALIEGKAISPTSMTVTNRTLAKAHELKTSYPEINIEKSAAKTAENSDLIFVCVKPHDVYRVLHDIKVAATEDKCVVSITSPISVAEIESVADCSAARIIPSITNRALSGVSLITFGRSCSLEWQRELEGLMGKISVPLEINEDITRVASDIVSCGPAFISYLIQRFINAAVEETKIEEDTATKLASEMLIGMGELLQKGYYTLPKLQEKVCVKGGITGEGIKVLERETGDMFNKLFQATHHKFKEDIENANAQFDLNIRR